MGIHHWIHGEVCRIPIPEPAILKDCLEQLIMLNKRGALHKEDPIEKRLNLLICCLDTGDSPTVEALKRQLEAVRNYKPR